MKTKFKILPAVNCATDFYENIRTLWGTDDIITEWKFKNITDHKMTPLEKRQLREKDEM